MSGELAWPQVKRIMNAYKDDDRFFKILCDGSARGITMENIQVTGGAVW